MKVCSFDFQCAHLTWLLQALYGVSRASWFGRKRICRTPFCHILGHKLSACFCNDNSNWRKNKESFYIMVAHSRSQCTQDPFRKLKGLVGQCSYCIHWLVLRINGLVCFLGKPAYSGKINGSGRYLYIYDTSIPFITINAVRWYKLS